MKKVVIALSGGLDSATALAWALMEGCKVIPVHFQYGSKHNAYEIEAVRQLVDYYGLRGVLREIDLHGVFEGFNSNLLQDQGEIPEGHYEAESMKLTVVPGRNLIFASILAGIAESEEANTIILGVHQGDHAIYPDCRQEFIESLHRTVCLSTDGKIGIDTPLLILDKQGVVQMGVRLGVPFHKTRTCYKEQPVACGKCGSCQERLEAFQLLGIPDPVPYEKA